LKEIAKRNLVVRAAPHAWHRDLSDKSIGLWWECRANCRIINLLKSVYIMSATYWKPPSSYSRLKSSTPAPCAYLKAQAARKTMLGVHDPSLFCKYRHDWTRCSVSLKNNVSVVSVREGIAIWCDNCLIWKRSCTRQLVTILYNLCPREVLPCLRVKHRTWLLPIWWALKAGFNIDSMLRRLTCRAKTLTRVAWPGGNRFLFGIFSQKRSIVGSNLASL